MTEESIAANVEGVSAEAESQDGDVHCAADESERQKAGSDIEHVEEESATAKATTSENEEQHVIDEDNNRSGELDKLAAKETVAKGVRPRPKRSLRPQGSHADAPQRKAMRSDKIPFWRSSKLRLKHVRGKSCEEQERSLPSAMESTSNVRVRSRSRNADRVLSGRQGLDDSHAWAKGSSEPAKLVALQSSSRPRRDCFASARGHSLEREDSFSFRAEAIVRSMYHILPCVTLVA